MFLHVCDFQWFRSIKYIMILIIHLCICRLSNIQRKGQKAPRRSTRSYLQLCPKTLHPDVLGEGRGQESTRRLPMREEQVHHELGSSRRGHSPGPARGDAPWSASGWTGHSSQPSSPRTSLQQQRARPRRPLTCGLRADAPSTACCSMNQWHYNQIAFRTFSTALEPQLSSYCI